MHVEMPVGLVAMGDRHGQHKVRDTILLYVWNDDVEGSPHSIVEVLGRHLELATNMTICHIKSTGTVQQPLCHPVHINRERTVERRLRNGCHVIFDQVEELTTWPPEI